MQTKLVNLKKDKKQLVEERKELIQSRAKLELDVADSDSSVELNAELNVCIIVPNIQFILIWLQQSNLSALKKVENAIAKTEEQLKQIQDKFVETENEEKSILAKYVLC